MWRKAEKLTFLGGADILWREVTPDKEHNWLMPDNAEEFRGLVSMADVFDRHTIGVKTNRDEVFYDWNAGRLVERVKRFIEDYNTEVYRHRANPEAAWPTSVKWSRDLKK